MNASCLEVLCQRSRCLCNNTILWLQLLKLLGTLNQNSKILVLILKLVTNLALVVLCEFVLD